MTQKSIYFHGPPAVADAQVQACRDGRMGQHRIPMKEQPPEGTRPLVACDGSGDVKFMSVHGAVGLAMTGWIASPFGPPGTVLAVKEAFRAEELPDGLDGYRYRADGHFEPIEDTAEAAEKWHDLLCDNDLEWARRRVCWRPPQHMPLEFVRMRRRIVRVWVHKVQDISEQDAKAHGVSPRVWFAPYDVPEGKQRDISGLPGFQGENLSYRNRFATVFDRIYAKHGPGWEKNPWVFAREWEVV